MRDFFSERTRLPGPQTPAVIPETGPPAASRNPQWARSLSNDQHVYLDTSFFNDLERRFHGCDGKACEFAEAYVIAHEVGHHVQNLFGTLSKAAAAQHTGDRVAANHMQVKVELQADCYAGISANHSEQKWKFIEAGDVEAALKTAAAIGDDRLERQAQGYVVPDSFTHGTSRATNAVAFKRAEVRCIVELQYIRRTTALKAILASGSAYFDRCGLADPADGT